jgi:HK97 family phage major capsid protein
MSTFNLMRALLALDADPIGRQWTTSYEAELSAAWARGAGVDAAPGRLYLPLVRDMTAAGVSGSNYIVGASNPGNRFLESLRAASVSRRLGAVDMPVGPDSVAVPIVTAPPSVYWLVDEGAQITESQPTIGSRPATPRTVAAKINFSRQLALQSGPAVENLLMAELARAMAAELDRVAVDGAGASGEPQGVLQVPGIGTQSGTTLAWAGIAAMVGALENANADLTTAGWLMDPATAEKLRTRPRLTDAGPILDGGAVAGYPAFVSTVVPANTLIVASWQNLYIARWGALELMTDPNSAWRTGMISLRAMLHADAMVAHPSGFVVATSIT